MNNEKNILLVGNGMDLRNGLKSSYSNYFDYIQFIEEKVNDINKVYDSLSSLRQKVFDDNFTEDFKNRYYQLNIWMSKNIEHKARDLKKSIKEMINEFDFNFWIIPIIMKEDIDSNWSSIERAIGKNLEEFNVNLSKKIEDFKKIVEYNCVLDDLNIDFKFFMMISIYMCRTCHNNEDDIKKNFKKLIKDFDINSFLYDELKRLEDSFKRYLINETEKNSYKNNVAKDLIKLCNGKTINIINFNYTDYRKYLEDVNVDNSNIQNIINIHGSIGDDDHIIFGIDTQETFDSNDLNIDLPMFTKTFRIMSNANIAINQFTEGCKKVKFFGHSLDKADYSYFQSIFDILDIYNSRVKLEFFYGVHGKASEEKFQNNIKSKVFTLMNDYGNKMLDRSHGRNLLHKMLLEGRLEIKNIDN